MGFTTCFLPKTTSLHILTELNAKPPADPYIFWQESILTLRIPNLPCIADTKSIYLQYCFNYCSLITEMCYKRLAEVLLIKDKVNMKTCILAWHSIQFLISKLEILLQKAQNSENVDLKYTQD